MPRMYDQKLVEALRDDQKHVRINDISVILKAIPDCDTPGAMDPRLYKETKNIALLTRFMPKNMLRMDTSAKSLAKLRKMFNSVDSTPIVEQVVKVTQDVVVTDDRYQLPIYCFQSATPLESAPILYFIHGGGFFAGSTDVVAEALKFLVTTTNIIVFSIDYRLAPEYPYPIGHEDCYTGLKWVAEHAERFGGNPDTLFIAGDSAGGNLTQYCTNRSLAENGQLVKGQLLLYPTVNMGGVADQYADFSKEKFEIYGKHASAINLALDMFAQANTGLGAFLGVEDLLTPALTPYLEVNSKLPPTFLTVGEHDYLKVETLAYARKLAKAGVETKTVVYKGMGHAYIDKVGYFPQSEDCLIEMGQFILTHL